MNVKQLQSFLLFVGLCVSGNAYGQTGTLRLDSVGWSKNGFLMQTPTYDTSISDTVAVYILITLKSDTTLPVMVTQQIGYSVTPRISYWGGLPRSIYLNVRKELIPDNYIVWMSVQRKEN